MIRNISITVLFGLAVCSCSVGAHQRQLSTIEEPDNQALLTLFQKTDAEISSLGFSGTVAISKDGRIVFLSANGLANRELQIENTTDTRFGLASTAKLFTAIATMQLAENGKLGLDDPVGRFLPNYPNETIRTKATIRHLLKMQSGLGDIFDYDADFKTFESHSDYIRLFERSVPDYPPGSDRSYSNAGFILLGRIIEVASDEDFYTYVEKNIFRPAGMKSTGYDQDGQQGIRNAISYRVEGVDGIAENDTQFRSGRLIPDTEAFETRGTAAGGGFSTVTDFVKLDKALREQLLISDASLAVIFSQAFVDGERPAGIAGGAPGVSTRYRLMPTGYSIVVFSNLDQPSAPAIADMYLRRLN